jgi:signal transduction histidine kinase
MGASAADLFPGGGEAGALIRAQDWSLTPVGPPEHWPASLTAQVRAMLHMRQPMSIFWGREMVNLYNDGFLPILGEKHPSAMGQAAREVWKDAWPVVGAQLERVLQGENVYFEETLVPIVRQGRLQDAWWNYSYSPLFDDSGAPAVVLVICTEVTNEVLQRRQLEVANHAKDHFLAMLGHELRNPLAPITTALQLMKHRADGAMARERDVIERQVSHMSRLVDDLLDVSRITSGKVRLDKRPISLATALSRAIEMAEPLIEEHGHHLEVRAPQAQLWVEADAMRLSQVVANLLTNAARYTPSNGRIALEARGETGEAVIEVTDNGIGIGPELLPHVFDLFVQGKRPLDRTEGGLGLGLALVKNLVSMHGGSVSVRSEGKDRGSCFSVRLPLVAQPGQLAPERVAPVSARSTSKRVLIVDDNVDAAELMADLLEISGHEPLVAHDGPQALRALEQFDASVAFLDIGLPVMDGYELARRIRALGRPIQLIALTGYGQPNDLAKSRAAGFDRHMVKPVVAEDALAAVESP